MTYLLEWTTDALIHTDSIWIINWIIDIVEQTVPIIKLGMEG